MAIDSAICIGCKFADWRKNADGKLHGSGDGKCTWQITVPLAASSSRVRRKRTEKGGFINRHSIHFTNCEVKVNKRKSNPSKERS